ncbi:SpvB and TcdB_toxin_midC domain-containing protein [Ktedonobacteria bacterium brp13]|nr:SpvB and TcdB_toxin_midC domain-containing protein [Ktedonobacteria bacterium brp13]
MLANTTGTSNRDENRDSGGNQIRPPSLSLPKGGGALHGIGEKFAANPVTGTGSMTVPIATSPGRSGFGPQISLSYDSGSGNGPFGFGWHLSLPAITRKTDKGLPRYLDGDESDAFILSGAEDLVPILVRSGEEWQRAAAERTVDGITYRVQQYRPRIDGLFSCIERWTNVHTGEIYWRSITQDNITTLYGKDNHSRIFDPADPDPKHPQHIFSWLICESYDDKGNAIIYDYKEEDSKGVDLSQAHESNRTPSSRSANRYLKSIKYGNRTPRLVQPDLAQPDWMFEVIFDYGEHDEQRPQLEDTDAWLCRHDPFSLYRSGFEVRTYRLCQRILMFHHFTDEVGVGQNCLVHSMDFTYHNTHNHTEEARKGNPVASFIASITQSGYKRQGDGYLKRSLPPLEFEYSQAVIHEEIREVDDASLENLPFGLDNKAYQWVDLDGEGVSGILTEQADTLFYKPNLGNGHFGPVERLASQPSLVALGSGRQQLLDLAGDGRVALAQFNDPVAGFYERGMGDGWQSFRTFASLPDINWTDPNLRFIDLTGDGLVDVLITDQQVFTWYPSQARRGFGNGERTYSSLNEEKGPALVFADGEQSIYLADMSGDGLTDLVRIRDGEVCYWPNLGYGRFGARVTMDNVPWFDTRDQFDQRRIRLADIDGSGTTDIIYLGREGVKLFFNQSGNSLSKPHILSWFPRVDTLSSVTVVDLLGNGTACIVWSSPLPGDARQPMRYIDLMGGQKPHLLLSVKNNLGAETSVTYASSTHFYLKDKAAGHPWITRLLFPVSVVERVETFDRVSHNCFVTRYTYHHGFYDGYEREFRGFGMVEQLDTEEFAALAIHNELSPTTNIDEASHVPPVLTKTWFHTGAYLKNRPISRQYDEAFYQEFDLKEEFPTFTVAQLQTMLLDDTILPRSIRLSGEQRLPYNLTDDEVREACRALKGSILRQEIYALDESEVAEHPYSISERNYTIEMLQPHGTNRHAVFFTHARETVDFHYERKLFQVDGRQLADPRVSHAMTLAVDDFGNVLRSVAIGYGRRHDDPNPLLTNDDREKQRRLLITYTENRYTNPIQEGDTYRTPLLCETRTYEMYHVTPDAQQPLVTNLFRFNEMQRKVVAASDGHHDLPYEDISGSSACTKEPHRRLIEHTRALYRRDDLSGPLPLGKVETMALPFTSYRQAFTSGLLAGVYRRERNGGVEDLLPDLVGMLGNEGRYIHSNEYKAAGWFPHDDPDDTWWTFSGRVFYSPGSDDSAQQEQIYARWHFFLPHRYQDPFGQTTMVAYDRYDLLLLETRDAMGSRVTAGVRDQDGKLLAVSIDYRVLQPTLVMDANRNRSAVAFDALGMVVGTAVMGKPEEHLGDSLDGFYADLPEDVIAAHVADPFVDPYSILQHATTCLLYDLFAYWKTRNAPHPRPVLVYIMARETHDADLSPDQQTKIQHSFSYSDGFGREIQKKMQAEPGPLEEGGLEISPRWVGSGWTIFNNKGKPVRQYEPFFSDTQHFEFARKVGVSPILFYDPVERVVATLHPNHTYEKVVFDPWRQTNWDVNDTVLRTKPQNDPDVGDFFRHLPGTNYLPTWYTQRAGGTLGLQEQDAANKAAVHAGTPTVTYLDTLGRIFLTVVHNRFERDSAIVEEKFATHVALDIEGNQREIIDSRNRTVMRYDYDMLSNRIHQASMEAGERWMLNDVAGKSIYAWDSRGHRFHTIYDGLRRPLKVYLCSDDGSELQINRTAYGEMQQNPEARNLRGKEYKSFDGAGVLNSDEYDFKGNLLHSSRQLTVDYKHTPDWSTQVELEEQSYTSSTTYDALNRPVALMSPDNSVVRPAYNEANLLERIEGNLQGEANVTTFVSNIDYNAKGQRTLIEYGNAVRTHYEYDPETFRLTHLLTLRGAAFPDDCPHHVHPSCGAQNLHYTYDPTGNITSIRDDAQQTIYFRNYKVEASSEYTYDATYRLITATGREHLGQTADNLFQSVPTNPTDIPRVGLSQPGDGNAMGRYFQQYVYDEVGNILNVVHCGTHPGNPVWARSYTYREASQLEPDKSSNRLSLTHVGSEPREHYTYDIHGNMTGMPSLPLMQWDYRDRLQATSQQMVNNGGTPEITYYVYDAHGQRVRKVTERALAVQLATAGQEPTRMKERIYMSGFEVYREYGGDGNTVTLERETLPVMDDRQHIALVETRTQGDDNSSAQLIRYQFSNHLGSAMLELDDQAQIISYEEYYPYGSTSYQAVRGQTETPKRYRYTGKERDGENGLYYHGARYYACWLGRWSAADSLDASRGQNAYQYVNGNPIKSHDPDGTEERLGFWQFQAEYWKGIGQGAAEFAGGLAHAVTSPRETYRAVKETTAKTYEKEGLLAAVNQFNPVYHALVSGYEYYQASKSGNPREAGKQAFRTVTDIASTALIATGGAGLAGRATSIASEAGGITLRVPVIVTAEAPGFGTVSTVTTKVVTIPARAVATVSNVATSAGTAGTGVMMMSGNGPEGGSGGSTGSSGASSGSPGSVQSPRPGGQRGPAAPAGGNASLLQQAVRAGVREAIEGDFDVFAHGTTRSAAQALVESQGKTLSAAGGNFGGRFFTTSNLTTAGEFAGRAAGRVAGETPEVVGIALPKAIVQRLRAQQLVKTVPIADRPGMFQTVFERGAVETLKKEGFFFHIQ